MNLDRREFRKVIDADSLDAAIEARCDVPGIKYLFIDEVQNVEGFEVVINGWREEGDVSIFLTSSNSYLLSGELATKLTGRYMELELFTLSFAEYEGMKAHYGRPISDDIMEEFDAYVLEGGFPRALLFNTLAEKQAYVREVIREIFEKDVRTRAKVRNTEEREYAPLERIADGYPKYLLTCDRLTQRRSGIYHENLVRFVSEDRLFLHQV